MNKLSDRLRSFTQNTKDAIREVDSLANIVECILSYQGPIHRIDIDDAEDSLNRGIESYCGLGRTLLDLESYYIAGYINLCGRPVTAADVNGQRGSCYHRSAVWWAAEAIQDIALRKMGLVSDSIDCGEGVKQSWLGKVPANLRSTLEQLLSTRDEIFALWLGSVQPVRADDIVANLTLELESAISVLAKETDGGERESTRPESLPDGPCGIDQWCYRGKMTPDRMKNKEHKLATHLFGRLGRKVPCSDLNGKGKLFDNIADDSIGRQGRKVSDFFAKNDIPLSVTYGDRMIWMTQEGGKTTEE